MKVYEIMFLMPELLKVLYECGIKSEDYKWIEMYRKYLDMKAMGHKTSYTVAVLSEEYKICERKVYKVLKKMGKPVS